MRARRTARPGRRRSSVGRVAMRRATSASRSVGSTFSGGCAPPRRSTRRTGRSCSSTTTTHVVAGLRANEVAASIALTCGACSARSKSPPYVAMDRRRRQTATASEWAVPIMGCGGPIPYPWASGTRSERMRSSSAVVSMPSATNHASSREVNIPSASTTAALVSSLSMPAIRSRSTLTKSGRSTVMCLSEAKPAPASSTASSAPAARRARSRWPGRRSWPPRSAR